MKATVWTRWNTKSETVETGKPKCIFNGEILSIPVKGDYIVVKDGFACETVIRVTHNFIANEIEIHIDSSDSANEYGNSLI